jgi:hypothetical protein
MHLQMRGKHLGLDFNDFDRVGGCLSYTVLLIRICGRNKHSIDGSDNSSHSSTTLLLPCRRCLLWSLLCCWRDMTWDPHGVSLLYRCALFTADMLTQSQALDQSTILFVLLWAGQVNQSWHCCVQLMLACTEEQPTWTTRVMGAWCLLVCTGIEGGLWQLRHHTFRRLAER